MIDWTARSRTALALTTTVCSLLLLGCGGTSDGDDSGVDGSNGTEPEYVLCDGPAGSWTDLTNEPAGWRDDGSERVTWTDDAGCAIRLDALFHSFGDEHCDWERVESISIGLPIGKPFSGPEADPPEQDWDPSFVFNTDGAIGDLPTGERLDLADVPTDALDIAAKTATDRRLRLAADEQTLYEIQGDDARAFVRISNDDISCA